MANVLPMAGLGSRFSTEGYRLPKPLIPVSGEPMICKVIDDLPEADTWVFIVRDEHVNEYDIDQLLESSVPGAEIVTVSETTDGPLCTALLAEPYLDPDEELLIAACDHGLLYDVSTFRTLRSREDVDAIVWTFTRQRSLEANPESWGWCSVGEDGETIVDVSVKTPVSSDPYDDHAIAGAFYFDRAADFVAASEVMLDEGYRVNDEYYIDAVPLFLDRIGRRSVIFDVDLYISWGTPQNLHVYEEMEYRCKHGVDPKDNGKNRTEKRSLWEAYFDA